MNRSILSLACMFVVWAGIARAQDTPTPATLPAGPLLVTEMPASAQWSVDYVYTDTPKPGQPTTLDIYKQNALKDPELAKQMQNPLFVFSILNVRPVHVMITTTGTIRHEQHTFEQDYKGESWKWGDVLVERKPNLPNLNAAIMAGNAGVPFLELTWISRANFTGIEKKEGHTYWIFKDKVDTVAMDRPGMHGDGEPVPVVVYIDSQTHLPLSLQFGVETRTYTFLPAPTSDLVVPDDFAAAGKAMLAKVHNATPHLAPPQ